MEYAPISSGSNPEPWDTKPCAFANCATSLVIFYYSMVKMNCFHFLSIVLSIYCIVITMVFLFSLFKSLSVLITACITLYRQTISFSLSFFILIIFLDISSIRNAVFLSVKKTL